MKDYIEFPPENYLIRVLKNCPKSAYIYTQIWKAKGRKTHLFTVKKDVRKEYLISPTLFRNLLSSLMFLNLLHFKEMNEGFQIDITGTNLDE